MDFQAYAVGVLQLRDAVIIVFNVCLRIFLTKKYSVIDIEIKLRCKLHRHELQLTIREYRDINDIEIEITHM